MFSLRDVFKKYTGFLRSLKVVYIINNFLNRKKLKHNKMLYKKQGLQKSIFAPIGSHDFKNQPAEIPWLDLPEAPKAILQHPKFHSFSKDIQKQMLNFIENGYLILKGFYTGQEVQRLNSEVDRLLEQRKTGFNYTGRKIMDAHRFSTLIEKGFFKNTKILQLLRFLLGRKVIPFQTINFREGSEQRVHSDSIHMMTEPKGFLIATWTALEDCHEGNGPLIYYPKSHRLPYITCQDYPSGNTKWKLGERSYKNYEDKVEATIRENHLEEKYFIGKKGDVFIWHANLLHGGSPVTHKGATRKSMVAHYFGEGVICYHEISQRPALLELK